MCFYASTGAQRATAKSCDKPWSKNVAGNEDINFVKKFKKKAEKQTVKE